MRIEGIDYAVDVIGGLAVGGLLEAYRALDAQAYYCSRADARARAVVKNPASPEDCPL